MHADFPQSRSPRSFFGALEVARSFKNIV